MEAIHAHTAPQHRLSGLEDIQREPDPRLKVNRRIPVPEFGTDGVSACHVMPGSGFVVALYVVVYSAGFQIAAPIPCASCHAPSLLTRAPYVTTRFDATCHVSCA